jgi:asmA family protein
LFSEHLYIVSNGYTDLNTQELSEDLLIRNTLNPSAKPIPLKIRGNVANPSVTLDYNRITHGLNNPKEKQKALEQTLREQWHWLNPERKQADK